MECGDVLPSEGRVTAARGFSELLRFGVWGVRSTGVHASSGSRSRSFHILDAVVVGLDECMDQRRRLQRGL